MLINQVFYAIKCNRCGEICEDGNDHCFWADEGTAIENAQESDWLSVNGKNYCTDCQLYDEAADEYKPLADYPAHLKALKKFFDVMVKGYAGKIITNPGCFVLKKALFEPGKLTDFQENFVKGLLGNKFISLHYEPKSERGSQMVCVVNIHF